MVGGVPRLVNAERHLVLELNPVAQAVINVNVGRFIKALRGIAIAHEDRIDLPIPVFWRVRIIRSKGRPALGQGQKRKAREGGEDQAEKWSDPFQGATLLRLSANRAL